MAVKFETYDEAKIYFDQSRFKEIIDFRTHESFIEFLHKNADGRTPVWRLYERFIRLPEEQILGGWFYSSLVNE